MATSDLADYLDDEGMSHTPGRPYHPENQEKIQCYYDSLYNLTTADVYYGRRQQVPDRRQQIKQNTLAMRRKMHYDNQIKS